MTSHSHVSNTENSKSPWTLVFIDWENLNWIDDNRKAFRLILMSNPAIYREITLEQIINDSPSYIHRWNVMSRSDVLSYPEKWSAISDPLFDAKCIDIFKDVNKNDYNMLFVQFYDRPIKYLHISHEELYEE